MAREGGGGGTPMRDWLICGHVALDECNVSCRATRVTPQTQVNKCFPPCTYIKNSGFEVANLQMFFFKFIKRLHNLKETKTVQQTTGNAAKTFLLCVGRNFNNK